MPLSIGFSAYKKGNALAADKNLPAFFWHTETRLNCLKQCLSETKTYAYNHHIQRLMVLGNFALLAGRSKMILEFPLTNVCDTAGVLIKKIAKAKRKALIPQT